MTPDETSAAGAQDERAEKPVFDPDQLALIPETDRRWSWVEIDLSAIRHNVGVARSLIKPSTRLLAVVKSDAYGHGAVRVAKTALQSGANYLAVATVDEGIKLREGMVGAPIVLLSEPPATAAPLLLAYKIMPSIYTPEFAIAYAEKADEYGIRAPFHLAVNTGMNRIGVRYDNVVDFMRKVSFHRALDLVGTFTHFATADCEGTLDFGIQVKRFTEAISALREVGIDPGIVHCANSAATVRYPQVHFDMVRWGVSLYGLHTCQETRSMINLKPAMSVHARITDTRTLPMSEGVSYGLNYRSPGSVKICTILDKPRSPPCRWDMPTACRAASRVAWTSWSTACAAARWATSAWTSACSRSICARTAPVAASTRRSVTRWSSSAAREIPW